MIQIRDKSDCCGCTACVSICSHNAIEMEPDALGFLYPKVNASKCTDCGLCEKVCAFNDNYDKSLNLLHPDVYGARHKKLNEVATSRSGAAFIAISDYILEKGGVVYGVGYKDHFRVCHKRAVTKEERDEFKGSKYVQSDLTGVFRQIKKDLKEGIIVLFSGTPCQTSGLNSYLGKEHRENLFLVDIVCHGVPSPYIWRDYLQYVEQKEKKTITAVNFRDKQKFGWTDHKESFILDKTHMYTDVYADLFCQRIMFRHSCGDCHFCNTIRPSDVTLADFWGWEKTSPDFNQDDKGVSLILINTEKGRVIFDSVKDQMHVFRAKLEDVLQPNLKQPSEMSEKRNEFETDYIKYGFRYVLRYCCKKNKKSLLKNFVCRLKNRLVKISHSL